MQKVLDTFLDVLDSIGSPYFDPLFFFPHGQIILLLKHDWAMNFIFRLNVIPLRELKARMLLLLPHHGDERIAFKKNYPQRLI